MGTFVCNKACDEKSYLINIINSRTGTALQVASNQSNRCDQIIFATWIILTFIATKGRLHYT